MSIRLENLITNDEYLEKKTKLDHKKAKLQALILSKKDNPHQVNMKIKDFFDFSSKLKFTFENALPEDRKSILKDTGSNFF